ncbi:MULTISPECIES: type II toxin-antitoxin system RelE/ParE family toxin [Moorena]|uniref:Plasmid stabilization protein n=1 Tax=Moorena bouillonii PNG TaxID=568701 RepID=A0A1U7N5M8_9CYAN|nr:MULTISPECIES: type II toxin-antitoxin system RelE/ParE family toxin [Moorena]NEO14397.1 type II toxin-antitoxin system RelE/ParE family toxin [Moorena sp. SIO3E8]NEQ01992.1 type II toxin-antitoxin system RelE/ParE family toxin [Moorena sp. SIO3F7]OLT61252.1 plasmid stabilization protein [Moorena bouillonii PNG]
MEIEYRELFLKDLKRLKKQPVYRRIMEVAFEIIPKAAELKELSNVKPLKGYPNRYRIRVGDYRIGIEVHGDKLEMMRVLHRREFYRYFP